MIRVVDLEQRLTQTLIMIESLGKIYGSVLDDISLAEPRTTADLEGIEYLKTTLPNIIESLSVVEQDIRDINE